jgi:hypothetical protein
MLLKIVDLKTVEKEGWTRRFTAREPLLSEAVDMYRELGFEVLLEPLPGKSECKSCEGVSDKDECRVCFDGVEDQYRIIYTKPGKETGEGDDLY